MPVPLILVFSGLNKKRMYLGSPNATIVESKNSYYSPIFGTEKSLCIIILWFPAHCTTSHLYEQHFPLYLFCCCKFCITVQSYLVSSAFLCSSTGKPKESFQFLWIKWYTVLSLYFFC